MSVTLSQNSGTGNKTITVTADANMQDVDMTKTFQIQTVGVKKTINASVNGRIDATANFNQTMQSSSGFQDFIDYVNTNGLPTKTMTFPYHLSKNLGNTGNFIIGSTLTIAINNGWDGEINAATKGYQVTQVTKILRRPTSDDDSVSIAGNPTLPFPVLPLKRHNQLIVY